MSWPNRCLFSDYASRGSSPKISGQGPAKIYKAGEMFFEPPGSVHEESANASQTEPAQLLAVIFAKKGSTLTTPVGRKDHE